MVTKYTMKEGKISLVDETEFTKEEFVAAYEHLLRSKAICSEKIKQYTGEIEKQKKQVEFEDGRIDEMLEFAMQNSIELKSYEELHKKMFLEE